MTIRTRFAPSPTGYLHIGGARTALFSWLHARKHRGRFLLRIEDTDRERSTQEAVAAILEGMRWLELDYDEGPYYQSARFERYQEVARQLIETGHAYYCYCSREELEAMRAAAMARGEKPRYDGRCRDRRGPVPADHRPVVRFRNPLDGEVVVEDRIQGEVRFQNSELDDLILLRADGVPTYNFTVVVDDLDMAITDVIRGDDHLNNTPRQMNIFRALGKEPPRYAHVPLILGPDGTRLSKRHGATSVLQYREDGYLPHALLNYLVRLGWAYGDQEIFSREEMVEKFDIAEVNKAAARFDPEKLRWLNQHYLKTADPATLVEPLRWQLKKLELDVGRGPDLLRLIEIQRERCSTLREMAEISAVFFREFESYDPQDAGKHLTPEALAVLQELRRRLEGLTDWTAPAIHQVILSVAEGLSLKLGKVAQPLRVAVSGKAVSPAIDATLELAGRACTLDRIDRAIRYIESRSAWLDSPRAIT